MSTFSAHVQHGTVEIFNLEQLEFHYIKYVNNVSLFCDPDILLRTCNELEKTVSKIYSQYVVCPEYLIPHAMSCHRCYLNQSSEKLKHNFGTQKCTHLISPYRYTLPENSDNAEASEPLFDLGKLFQKTSTTNSQSENNYWNVIDNKFTPFKLNTDMNKLSKQISRMTAITNLVTHQRKDFSDLFLNGLREHEQTYVGLDRFPKEHILRSIEWSARKAILCQLSSQQSMQDTNQENTYISYNHFSSPYATNLET